MIRATVTCEGAEHLEHLLRNDEFANARAKYAVERRGHELHITIEAKDAVALRACVTSITRVLALYEKAKQHGQGNERPDPEAADD